MTPDLEVAVADEPTKPGGETNVPIAAGKAADRVKNEAAMRSRPRPLQAPGGRGETETAPEIGDASEGIGRTKEGPVLVDPRGRAPVEGLERDGEADTLGGPPKEYAPDEA